MIGNRDEIKEKLREKTSPHIGMGGRFFSVYFLLKNQISLIQNRDIKDINLRIINVSCDGRANAMLRFQEFSSKKFFLFKTTLFKLII